jgi:hypothetical protein
VRSKFTFHLESVDPLAMMKNRLSPSNLQPAIPKLVFPLPAWRYALLFQSWSQFQSWALTGLLTALAITALLVLVKANVPPVGGLLAGSVLGSLISVVTVLPAEFEFKQGSASHLVTLQNYLEHYGYVRIDNGIDAIVYRQNLPKLLRWEEGQVRIERTGDRIVVKGPLMILRKLRRALVANEK